MTEKHTLRSFEDALEGLSSQILTMGLHVLQMVETAGKVFRERNVEGAKELVSEDLKIDRQHDAINAAVVDVLSRFNPVARDLREVLAIEHVAANLERVADHAKSIAKRSISGLAPLPSGGSADLLNQLHGKVVKSLRDVLHALGDRDVLLADKVHRSDDQMDQIFDDLFHTIIADLQASQGAAVAEVQTLFVGKSLERIGDHATNIAEEIRFMTKGDLPSATREV